MSKENTLKKYGVAGISDVLSCFGVPTAVASQIYADVLQKRGAEALEILLSEIRQGHFKNIDQHEAVSIVARFQRDAMEGVARTNLRLMARVINGMAEKQELTAPSFLKYASILASLSDNEIVVLGIMTTLNWETFIGPRGREKFIAAGILNYEAIQQSLLRTGLVMMQTNTAVKRNTDISSLNRIGDDEERQLSVQVTQVYTLTPLMDEILKYADFLIKDKDK